MPPSILHRPFPLSSFHSTWTSLLVSYLNNGLVLLHSSSNFSHGVRIFVRNASPPMAQNCASYQGRVPPHYSPREKGSPMRHGPVKMVTSLLLFHQAYWSFPARLSCRAPAVAIRYTTPSIRRLARPAFAIPVGHGLHRDRQPKPCTVGSVPLRHVVTMLHPPHCAEATIHHVMAHDGPIVTLAPSRTPAGRAS